MLEILNVFINKLKLFKAVNNIVLVSYITT